MADSNLKSFVRPNGKIYAKGAMAFPKTKQPYKIGDRCEFTDVNNSTLNIGKVIAKEPSEDVGWFNLTVEIVA